MRREAMVRRGESGEIAVQQISWIGIGGGYRVQSATRKSEPAASEPAVRKSAPAAKRAKLSVLLVTGDDTLWPQIGSHLSADLVLKQVDSVDELITATTPGQPAIVLLDTRAQADGPATLSRMQLHSPRFAVVVLDEVGSAHSWTGPIALRQVVALVAVPIQTDKLSQAVENAHEEVNARMALLGDSAAAAPSLPSAAKKFPLIPAAIVLAVLIAGAATFFAMRKGGTPVQAPPAAIAQQAPPPAAAAPSPGADEKVDLLIEKAQQAMTERHFIDPADGSALTLYRSALLLAPQNGERSRACSGSPRSCSRGCNPPWTNASSTSRCNRSKPPAASTPATAAWRRSTNASWLCGPNWGPRRYWPRSTRRTSTAPRS